MNVGAAHAPPDNVFYDERHAVTEQSYSHHQQREPFCIFRPGALQRARWGCGGVLPARICEACVCSRQLPDTPNRWLQDVSKIARTRLLGAEDSCADVPVESFGNAQSHAMKIGRDKKVICYLNAASGDWGGAS